MLGTVVEHQTAFLNAHAESMRLRRVLVERSPGVDATPRARVPQTSAVPPDFSPTPASPRLESTPATNGELSSRPSTQDQPSPDAEQSAELIVHATDLQPIGDPASLKPQGGQAKQRTDNAAARRGERYYRVQQPTGAVPARPTSLQGLDVLRRIQATGDVGHLVLMFGPHVGETLGQVAQSDPDSLRGLATAFGPGGLVWRASSPPGCGTGKLAASARCA